MSLEEKYFIKPLFALLAGYMRIFLISAEIFTEIAKLVWDFVCKKTVNLEFCDRVWSLFRMTFFISLRKLSAHIYAAKKVNKYKMRIVIPEANFIYLSITIKNQQPTTTECVYKVRVQKSYGKCNTIKSKATKRCERSVRSLNRYSLANNRFITHIDFVSDICISLRDRDVFRERIVLFCLRTPAHSKLQASYF